MSLYEDLPPIGGRPASHQAHVTNPPEVSAPTPETTPAEEEKKPKKAEETSGQNSVVARMMAKMGYKEGKGVSSFSLLITASLLGLGLFVGLFFGCGDFTAAGVGGFGLLRTAIIKQVMC